jgi:hypothetical protein
MRVPRVRIDETGPMPTPGNYAKHILAVGNVAVPRVTIDEPADRPDTQNILKSKAVSGPQIKIRTTQQAAVVVK